MKVGVQSRGETNRTNADTTASPCAKRRAAEFPSTRGFPPPAGRGGAIASARRRCTRPTQSNAWHTPARRTGTSEPVREAPPAPRPAARCTTPTNRRRRSRTHAETLATLALRADPARADRLILSASTSALAPLCILSAALPSLYYERRLIPSDTRHARARHRVCDFPRSATIRRHPIFLRLSVECFNYR